jgi:hypothetical protein
MSSRGKNVARVKQSEEDDENDVNRSADVTSVFDPTKIKTLLYREEPKMARIPVPSLKLIGATSALFLKNLIEEATAKMDDNNKDYVTLERLRNVVSTKPSFQFLQETMDDVKDTDSTHNLKEYVPTISRKRTASSSREKLKKVAKSMEPSANTNKKWNEDAPLEEAITNVVNTTELVSGQLVADEDDYD